jgi:hypothetical protein
VPPTPATHWENVLAELQANAPGVQGPAIRAAEGDADVEVEVEVTVLTAVFDASDDVVDVDKVVEEEVSNDVVFEKVGSCEEEIEDELRRDVVLEKVGGSEGVGDTTIKVATVTENAVVVVLAYGPDVSVADGMVMFKAVLFDA